MDNTSESICRSVFKGGKNTPSKKLFTEKWIELINKKNKGTVCDGKLPVCSIHIKRNARCISEEM